MHCIFLTKPATFCVTDYAQRNSSWGTPNGSPPGGRPTEVLRLRGSALAGRRDCFLLAPGEGWCEECAWPENRKKRIPTPSQLPFSGERIIIKLPAFGIARKTNRRDRYLHS